MKLDVQPSKIITFSPTFFNLERWPALEMEKFRKTRSVHIRYIYEFGTHTSKSIRYLVFYIVRMEKIRVQLILFHAAFTLDPSKILRLEPVCPLGHSTDHPCTRKSFESKSNAKNGMKGPVGTWYRPLHINQQVRNTQSLQAEANIGCPRIFSFVFSPVWLFTIRLYEYKDKDLESSKSTVE